MCRKKKIKNQKFQLKVHFLIYSGAFGHVTWSPRSYVKLSFKANTEIRDLLQIVGNWNI